MTLNPASDAVLVQMAGWRLHLGTWPGMRYPSLTIDLAVAPHLIGDVLPLKEGDRVQVINLPPQHPTEMVDLIVEGITETVSPSSWLVELTCSPAGPYTVGVLEDEVLGRLDTDGSETTAWVSPSATTLTVDTPGIDWITTADHPAEFPFDIRVGGEVMTVTAITGASPQDFTVTRSVNGVVKPHPAGTSVALAHPLVLAL